MLSLSSNQKILEHCLTMGNCLTNPSESVVVNTPTLLQEVHIMCPRTNKIEQTRRLRLKSARFMPRAHCLQRIGGTSVWQLAHLIYKLFKLKVFWVIAFLFIFFFFYKGVNFLRSCAKRYSSMFSYPGGGVNSTCWKFARIIFCQFWKNQKNNFMTHVELPRGEGNSIWLKDGKC